MLVSRNGPVMSIAILSNGFTNILYYTGSHDLRFGPLVATQTSHLRYQSLMSSFRLTQKNLPLTVSQVFFIPTVSSWNCCNTSVFLLISIASCFFCTVPLFSRTCFLVGDKRFLFCPIGFQYFRCIDSSLLLS